MTAAKLTLAQALDGAFAACHAGKLADAEQLCRRILDARSDLFDAVHLLAFVQSKLGKKEAALAGYDRALALRPHEADALNNRGNVLQELGRYEAALASYECAIAARPDFADAFNNRGLALAKLRRPQEALASYDSALALRANYPEALNNRGRLLHALRRFDEAVASYDRALKLRPLNAEALYNRGNALARLRRGTEALASYDGALRARPNYPEALYGRGNLCLQLRRFAEALASYDRALALQPAHADALNNRGNALQELGRYEEAVASYEGALKLRPAHVAAFYNRGNALYELERYEEALESCERALALRPDDAVALNNRGNALQQLTRFDEALAAYERAVAIRPDYPQLRYNRAVCRLLLGDFDRGWEEHEWRWQCDFLRSSKPKFTEPIWTGREDITGKTILLVAEQGFGDAIQFCRYAPLVAQRGARVVLQVREQLSELMRSLAGVAQVATTDPPRFDVYCPLLSLPLAFGTRLETIPSSTPYLSASPRRISAWAERLAPRRRPWIGLAWSGHPIPKHRSISLTELAPLFEIDATFVRLQNDIRPADAAALNDRRELVDFGRMEDFADTAALMANLDLVISVDTGVAHLAGALAKPVWVLLPFVPDWRWLLERDDSPWYPTARLFRQDETRAWQGVIGRARAALDEFVGAGFKPAPTLAAMP